MDMEELIMIILPLSSSLHLVTLASLLFPNTLSSGQPGTLVLAVSPPGIRAPLGQSPNVPLISEAFSDQPIIIATPFPGAPYLSSQLYTFSCSSALISNCHSIYFSYLFIVSPNWNVNFMKARIWACFAHSVSTTLKRCKKYLLSRCINYSPHKLFLF